jgi:hypothetical protein
MARWNDTPAANHPVDIFSFDLLFLKAWVSVAMVSPLSINFWERVRWCPLDRLAQVQRFPAMLLYAPLERSQLAVRILSGVALLKIQ